MMIDLSIIRGIGTAILFLAFIGLCLRVYWPKRKSIYQDYGRLPLDDNEQALFPNPSANGKGEQFKESQK